MHMKVCTNTASEWAGTSPPGDRRLSAALLGGAVALALGATQPIRAQDADGPETLVLQPINVAGEAAESPTGPVEGYVAERSATATKTDTPLIETPQSISVITADRMEDQGVQSVQDALRYTAGVRGETFGLDSRGDWSSIRGADPVLFQDGLQQAFSYYANARPDPFTLERVEALKGPSSVLYGQSTVGGIVNLVSKRPLPEQQGELQLQYGNFDRRQLGLDLTGPLNEDGSLLYRVVGVVRDSDTQVNHVEDDRLVLMPSLTWRPSDAIEWTLLANLQEDDTGSTTQFLPHAGTVLDAPGNLPQIPIDVFMSEPGFDEYDTEQQSITSLLTVRPNDTWTLRQNLRYSQSEVSYQTLYPQFPPVLQPDGDIQRVYWVSHKELDYLNVDNQAQADFGSDRLRHTLLVGLDYQHATVNDATAYGVAGELNLYDPVYGNATLPGPGDLTEVPENTIEQVGVYVQDQLTVNDRWIAVLGLRQDRAENETEDSDAQTDDALTKRIGLMYRADNGLAPYVSYAESFEPVIGVDVFGDAYEPKEGRQIEVGVKYQPEGSDSFITAAVYDLREENRQVPDPNVPNNQIQTGEARARGVELEGLVAVTDRWDLIGTYTHTDTEVLEGDNEGAHLPSVPENMASLWSQHRFSLGGIHGFSAGVGVRYVGHSWDGEDSLKTPGYTLYDAMLGYVTGPWRFALNVNNIEDETYYTTCLARGDCFVGTKRTVVGTLSYRF